LHYAELYTKHLGTNATPKQIEVVKARLAEADIKMNAHGVHNFTANHDRNRQLFEFAKAAGIGTLTANPQPDAFDSLDKLCEEYKIRIAIHNHGPGAIYDGLKNVQERVKDRHPLVGACVDTGHVLRSGQNPVEWITELGPRVYALHIKDVAEMRNKTHDVIIGQGHLDVVGIFKAAKAIDFPADGVISMEYEANPANPIEDVQACLVVAQAAIEKVWG
jgi:sugar phosphate isomerase/epimerase